jgi:DNA-binding response OmpR family regulator
MKKLLIVDDNQDIVEILQMFFEVRGYDVIKLFRGEEVIETVRQQLPDLILLDIYLGSTNGLEICCQLKSEDSLKHIPLIMFSAHGKKDEVLKQCPADDFIAKPFDLYHLSDVVASSLGGPKGS